MKKLACSFWGCWIVILALLVPHIACAKNGIVVAPTQLTVTGMRGAVEQRRLLIRTSEPITELQLVALDLTRVDGAAVFPATAIEAVLPTDTMDADDLLTLTVTIHFQDAPSGEFQGDLLLNFQHGTITVPITARVKDAWIFPLLVLLAGVGLGVGVSVYRARGKPRDEMLVQIGEIRSQMRSDKELNDEFRSRIKSALIDAEVATQTESWHEAQEAFRQAESIWRRWRKGRPDWLEQFAYAADLRHQIDALHPDAFYLRTLRRALDDVARLAPTLDGPDKLREQLGALANEIEEYVQLQHVLDKLTSLRDQLDEQQSEQWRLRVLSMQRRLHGLNPDNEGALLSLQEDINAAFVELSSELPQPKALVSTRPPEGEKGITVINFIPLAPVAHPLPEEEETLSAAQLRLRWFTLTMYAVAILLLAGAGFGELYVANSTFGSNAWSDYFALLAWGFGAEVTRASVTEMVKGWGLGGK